MLARPLFLLPLAASVVLAVPTEKRGLPTVQLDNGTFLGISDGLVSRFLGIPFGKAPYVGHLHLTSFHPPETHAHLRPLQRRGPPVQPPRARRPIHRHSDGSSVWTGLSTAGG